MVTIKAMINPVSLGIVNTAYTNTITLTLIAKDGTGTMGSTTCTAASGSCDINSCTITGSGTFIFQASGTSAVSVYSSPFTVSSGTVSTVVLDSVTTAVYRGQSFSVTGTARDSSSALVNSAIQFILTVSSGSGSIVSGSVAVLSMGILTFSSVIIDKSGSHTLTVTCSSCSTAPTVTTITIIVNTYGLLVIEFPDGILESQTNQYYKLSLSAEPTSDVVIYISSSDTSIISTNTASLTFTSSNYATAQNVIINVNDLATATNPYSGTKISHTLSSSDYSYSGTADMKSCMISSNSIAVPIYGYQEYAISVDPSVSVAIASQVPITVSLGAAPTSDVTISLSATTVTLSTSKLIFTSSDWAEKTFYATAPSSITGSYQVYTVAYSISTSDSSYSSGTLITRPSPLSTSVIVYQKSTYSIVLDQTSMALKSKYYGSVFVRLSADPSGDVIITITSSASTDITVSPSTLTFSSSTGKVFQEVSLFAADGSGQTAPSYTVTITMTVTTTADSRFPITTTTTTFVVSVINICIGLPYNWPSSDLCACPAGFDCQGNEPVPCPAGTYNYNSYKCTPCPAGYRCSDPAVDKVACDSGFYSYDYYTQCYPCPPGYRCPSTDKKGTVMMKCVQGSYSGPGSSTCTTPADGKMAPSPEYPLEISCPTGYYTVGSKDMCAPCPAGYSCSSTTATACTAGTYSLVGMGTCSTCPDHHECDPALGPTRICPEGTYRASGSYMCTTCTAGYYCTAASASRPEICPAGYTSVAGSAYCTATSGTWENYPGLKIVSDVLTSCDDTEIECFVRSYDEYMDYIRCTKDYGICYAIPSGETRSGTATSAGFYSYPGSDGTAVSNFIGYYTPPHADRPDMVGFECEQGYYCTDAKTKIACPVGYFNPGVRGTALADCMFCPPGYDCPVGTGDYELYPCLGGKYCKGDAAAATDCPGGFYRNKLRGIEKGSCEQCPDGNYCPTGNTNPLPCARGYIGPLGSDDQIACPEGTYNMYDSRYKIEDCVTCPAGSYCEEAADTPIQCAPGYHNPYSGSSQCFLCTPGYACIGYGTVKPFIKCSIGYYCPEGSKAPIERACPPGTVGTQYGAYSVTQCEKCPKGYSCGFHTNYVNNPPVECPAGYYCPIGTEFPQQYPCLEGTYNARTRVEGSHECLDCLEGFYCLNATATDPSNACPTGYYCPRATKYAEQYPCPAGTYRGTTGAKNRGECLMCSVGHYCPIATSIPIECPAGTFMNEFGAQSEGPGDYPACKPCPSGSYSAAAGSTTCIKADSGYYTYKGASSQIQCPAGYFCPQTGTSEYAMYNSACPPGYLCPIGTSTYPTVTGSMACPTGNYCLEKSSTATPCPIGTYRITTAAKSVYDCAASPAGYYVSATGTSDYTPFECAEGHYCPTGSISEFEYKCPQGTYRNMKGGKSANDCATCPPGYYCASEATVDPVDCPETKYCPAGTITPIQCPAGTYGPIGSLNLKTSADCTSCDKGSYCAYPGLSTMTGSCKEGYYCIGGSTLEAPTDGVTGDLCPAGGFCLVGATSVSTCDPGKFNNFEGGWSSADCVPCWPGYYCAGDNNPSPTAQCAAGYYCTGSASTSQQFTASAGNYAPLGAVAEIPCLAGTYSSGTAFEACVSCPAGTYCPTSGLSLTTTCDAGYYCLIKSYVKYPCPYGTYRASTGAQSVDDCTACTGGKYCLDYGLIAVTGDCDAGYYCFADSYTNQPWVELAGFYGRCPEGEYCEAGSSEGTPCDIGYYNPSKGAEDSTGCVACPAGWACPNTGSTSYTLECRRGYYCEEASTTSQPTTVCDAGYYCPAGSAFMQKCAAGTYTDVTQEYSCKTCPPGYYCPIGTNNYFTYLCPAGFYCPAGTTYSTEHPCLAGTFNPYEGQQTSLACQSCTAGSYCDTKGISATRGYCAKGFYCNSGSTSPRPRSSSEGGGRCTRGYYCPEGSSSATACDSGKYCPDDEMYEAVLNCNAGYYCISAATTPTPTDGVTGYKCPIYYYCEAGTTNPSSCDPGYYIPYVGASSSSDCIICTPGYYCQGADPVICPEGYYCPEGSESATNQCERGYFCPGGSDEPRLCEAGTYQDNSGEASCKDCEAGYYCPSGSYSMTLCPKGHYCLINTMFDKQYPCDVGYYNSNIGSGIDTACTECEAGKFCSSQGADAASGLCSEGYYCSGGAYLSKPTDGITGDICEAGYYCEEGSKAQTECDAGYYCNQQALGAVSGMCSAGYYCTKKATKPNPTDGTTGDICEKGKYCPEGSSLQELCPSGTYGSSKGYSSKDDCLPCNYGHYCSSAGLTAPSGLCNDGYYCEPGKDSPTPTDGLCPKGYFCKNNVYIFKYPCEKGNYNLLTGQSSCTGCTDGYYCEGGTADRQKCPKGYECHNNARFSSEYPCPPGEYADQTGLTSCQTCTIGNQCNNAAQTTDSLCPTYKYCPAGTGFGILCPPGRYNKDYQSLGDPTECTLCPAGQYCVDGTISGQCAPGFWCKGGSSTPTPTTTTDTGLPCPPGYYCPKGTTSPVICPDGKFRKDSGARAETDCTSCPPGSYCVSGETTPYDCTTGHYCTVGVEHPIPCPKRTYNDQTGADNPNWCKICPPGYFCNAEGISLYTDYPCKAGYFCVQGATGYINCPPGTYTFANNAGSTSDCLSCPGGFYCPANTTDIISCPEGTYCSGGNSLYWPCPPGYLCFQETVDPIPCPAGQYCPLYNQLDSSIDPPPKDCETGTLCPGGYFDEATCSAGYYYSIDLGQCIECPPGYYSAGQKSESCQLCDAGYICTGGATRKDPQDDSDGGYPCPQGYYCPQGTSNSPTLEPSPCPITTYNPKIASVDSSACILCPTLTYGDEIGQPKCKPCGSHANSTEGSTTCTCVGLYRFYQKYDGSCFCIPTYEFLDNGVYASEVDSSINCEPIKFKTCVTGEKRSANGDCVSTSGRHCKDECGDDSNAEIDEATGLCPCDNLPSQDTICDTTCIESMPQVTILSDGSYNVYDPASDSTINLVFTASNYLSSVTCDDECQVHAVSFTATGIEANYGVPKNFEQDYYSQINRRLQISSNSINSPLACALTGDTFVFSLTPKSYFPSYLKNSLINTNKNFDYAAFKELEWRMRSSESNVDTFAFTFTEEGYYDFVDSYDNNKHIIIKIVSSLDKCTSSTIRERMTASSSTVFYTRTADNTNAFGISASSGMLEEPNWGIIAGILVASFIMLLVFIALLAFLHWRAWASSHARERLLQLVKDCCKRCRISRPALVAPLIVEDESDSIDVDKDLLEPSQFTEMLQKLARYYNQLEAAFDSQDEDAKRSLEDLLGQAKDIKIMLGDRLSDIDPVMLREKVKEAHLDSSEDDAEEQIPEIVPLVVAENLNMAMNALKEAEAEDKAKRSKEIFEQIMSNPNLVDSEKEELIKDFNASLQRLDQALDQDMEQAQKDISKRLQERAARRKAAEREKAYFEPKKQEINVRTKKELDVLDREFQNEAKVLDDEFIQEKEKMKKENRKEVEEKLKEMRTQLQNDLMSARNQAEIDNLMKIFEIESRRIEEQLQNAKSQKEAEDMKRLEERRQKRLDRIKKDAHAKKAEIEARTQEELDGIEQRALLATGGKVNVEIQLDMSEEQLVQEVVNNFDDRIVALESKHQAELKSIDQEIQMEDNQRIEEKERLEKMIQTASSPEEKSALLKALEDLEAIEAGSRARQEDKMKARLLERKRRRAEKEALLKSQQDKELKDLELQKHDAEKNIRSDLELKKMEDLLENAEIYTPEQLIAMARELLETKHDKETANLTALKHANLRDRQNETLKNGLKKKAEEKAATRTFFEETKNSILKEKIDPETKKAKLDELANRAQEAENQIDFGFIVGLNTAQDKIWRETEEDFKQRFIDLADAQGQEILKIMSKIKGVDSRMLDANIADMEKEIESQRAELGRKHAEKLRELDKRASEFKEIEKQKMMEIDFINGQMRETEERQRKLDEVQEQRRQMEDRQRKVLEAMKERGISPEKMEEMLKQHQREMDEWEKAMELERQRQQQRLQSKLDAKRQKYQEKIASQIQKYKEENLKLIEQQEDAEQNKMRIVFDCGRDIKIWTPVVEIDTRLRFPDMEEEQEIEKIASTSVLDEVIEKVRRVEKIADNIDSTQFEKLLKAFKDVNDMMEKIKTRL